MSLSRIGLQANIPPSRLHHPHITDSPNLFTALNVTDNRFRLHGLSKRSPSQPCAFLRFVLVSGQCGRDVRYAVTATRRPGMTMTKSQLCLFHLHSWLWRHCVMRTRTHNASVYSRLSRLVMSRCRYGEPWLGRKCDHIPYFQNSGRFTGKEFECN